MIEIPSFLYGKFADVKKESSKIVTKLKKGVPIGEIVSHYSHIPVSSVPGKIILDGPNPNNGAEDHFHLFALPRLLVMPVLTAKNNNDHSFSILMQTFFNDMMPNFWSHMVMSCGQSVYPFYSSNENKLQYLRHLVTHKENYLVVNDRFEGLPMIAWNLQGELTTDIKTIFDYPSFIAKYIVGNLDHVKSKFSDEEINHTLVNTKLFDCMEKFQVEEYINSQNTER